MACGIIESFYIVRSWDLMLAYEQAGGGPEPGDIQAPTPLKLELVAAAAAAAACAAARPCEHSVETILSQDVGSGAVTRTDSTKEKTGREGRVEGMRGSRHSVSGPCAAPGRRHGAELTAG